MPTSQLTCTLPTPSEENLKLMTQQRNGCAPGLVQVHSPRRNDGTECLQDISSSQALLGVEDQQFPDKTHCALRDPSIPAHEEEGEASAW